MARLPISPETIFQTDDGRWAWYDVDVTDYPFWWKCAVCDHKYRESIASKIAAADAGTSCCPACSQAISQK